MNLPVATFDAVVLDISQRFSDDFAHAIYQDCLEDSSETSDSETRFKRGLLLQESGGIEQRRGDYAEALASYRQARDEITDFDEIYSLQLFVREANLLVHKLDDPAASIEPYEAAVRIFENHFVGPANMSRIPDHPLFETYIDVLSHTAGAYQHTGDRANVRHINDKLAGFGGISGAIFGFDSCEHANNNTNEAHVNLELQPLFKDIQDKLISPLSAKPAISQVRGLRSLETFIDQAELLPDAPEQRDYILMLIYSRYGALLPNLGEQESYINRALKIAKSYSLPVPQTQLYMTLTNNQAGQGRPVKEQHKIMKKSLLAAEAALDAGASAEAACITQVAELVSMQLTALGDSAGIEELKQRLRPRGLVLKSTSSMPFDPNMN